MNILITGATGHVGSELTRRLSDSNHKIRALLYNTTKADNLPDNIEKVAGDLENEESLHPAFAGMDRVYVIDTSHQLAIANNVVAAAKKAGVKTLVVQSSIGAGIEPLGIMGRWFHDRENIYKSSGLEWTFLRPTSFMSNAFMWLPTIKAEGVVRDASGNGRVASIAPADIAAVAALALAQEGHQGKTYTLTGPELQTARQQVEILSRVLERPITFQEITPEEAAQQIVSLGMGNVLAEAVRDLNETFRSDRVAVVTDTFEALTGKKPVSFEQWCRQNKNTFL